MITPIFSVTQDSSTITVTMRTPYIKADELELDVMGSSFKCHVRPYYLSLTFKQLLQEGGENARWDVDKNEMTVTIPKATPGEHFDNLDMLTELLTQPKKRAGAPVGGNGIEVLQNSLAADEGEGEDAECEDEDFDWEIPQQMPAPVATEELLKQSKYGFNDRHQGVFKLRQVRVVAALLLALLLLYCCFTDMTGATPPHRSTRRTSLISKTPTLFPRQRELSCALRRKTTSSSRSTSTTSATL